MSDTFQKLFSLFSPRERRQAYLIFLAMLGMAILDVIGVASIMPFMSIVSNPSSLVQHDKLYAFYQALHFESARHFLLFLGFIVLGVLLIGNTYTIFTTWLITRFAMLRQYSLSKRLLNKYLTEDYSFFLNQNTANLCSNILTEIQIVVNGIFMPALQLIAKLIVTLLMLTLLFWVNPLLALTSLIFLGAAYSVIYLLARRKLMIVSEANVVNNQLRHKVANEALGGIRDIKLLNKEQVFVDRFSIPARQLAEYNAISQTVALVPRYALETIAFGGVLLIVIYFLLVNKEINEVTPMLALYAFACFRLMPALQNIFSSLTTMKAGKGALNTVYQDLGPYQVVEFVAANVDSIHLHSELMLRNISFAYNSTRTIIDNLNLIIPAKSTIGFVGVTGSGKTTTAELIAGLLCPTQGDIFVDGVKINERNLRVWQKKLGYVSQAIYLADDTVANNIAFGVAAHEVNMDAVIRAAKIANIHEFVMDVLSQQYNTLIGERGVRLSGGQRQRLGIARALYYDPDILILDEATSSLDSVTENAIMDAVHALSHKKTIIIIAHRLTTVKECDVIHLFENGKIVKSGNYHNLLESNDLFKKLVNMS